MNREQLIETIAAETGESKAATERFLISMLKTVQATVATGEPVALLGFGTFTVTNTSERQSRNPRTGEAITIPAGRRVKFKAGTKFVDTVKNGCQPGVTP